MPTNNFTRTIVCKKHWTVFVYPITLLIPALLLFFINWKILKWVAGVWGIGILLRIFWLSTVKWTLTATTLYIRKGFIPGKRGIIVIQIEDIYQSLVSYLLFSPYFNCGHISISRIHQLGEVITGRSLRAARELSAEINLRVWNHKMTTQINSPVPPSSVTIELLLNQLSALKSSGNLSVEDYELIRNKIQPAMAS
jgi:hypothetical protein